MTNPTHDNGAYVTLNETYWQKKPVVVAAIQWDGSEDSQRAIVNWAGGKVSGWFDNDGYYLECATLEGQLRVSPMDWVLRGIQGEFYPCKPDIFEATYELAGLPE